MNGNSWMHAACVALAVALAPGEARSQEAGTAGGGDWEMSAGIGYGQGLGPVGAEVSRLQRLGASGGTVELDLSRRFHPRWSVGMYGDFSLFNGAAGSWTNHATSAAVGLELRVRARPGARNDPWASLGAGYRGYWGFGGWGTQELQGMDFARLRAGVDYWTTPSLAIGPMFGVTLTEFFRQKPPARQAYENLEQRKLNTILFAGIAGRFTS